jgi:hypothetical protein
MNKLFIFGTALFLVLGLTNKGSAHSNYDSSHSVDNGEIRWGTYHGSTKYTSARNNAISKWDAVGVINIAGDTSTTIEDLSFTDYSANDGVLGYWRQYSGADKIAFNDYYFQDMSDCERNHTALHELGHALDLEHNSVSGSVMNSGKICRSSLGDHDVEDLEARW